MCWVFFFVLDVLYHAVLALGGWPVWTVSISTLVLRLQVGFCQREAPWAEASFRESELRYLLFLGGCLNRNLQLPSEPGDFSYIYIYNCSIFFCSFRPKSVKTNPLNISLSPIDFVYFVYIFVNCSSLNSPRLLCLNMPPGT